MMISPDCFVEAELREKDREKALKIVKNLRKEILDSNLPIIVDVDKKEYDRMGNVTCAAAATTGGCLIKPDEFYRQYNV